MNSPKRLLALTVLPIVFLAGCGSDDSKSSKSSSSSASGSSSSPSASSSSGLAAPVTNGNLDDVKVDTKNAAKPTVTIAQGKLPFGTKNATPKMLTEGTGKAVGDKDLVHANFIMVNGTTGKTIGSTFGQTVPSFNLADQQNLPGIMSSLKGKKVGSKFVVSLPPAQAFGAAGNQQIGLGGNDNVVMYMEVDATDTPLPEAKGTAQTPPADLPKVSVPAGQGKEAKITVAKGAKAPTSLKTATLIEGDGPAVKSGQTIAASYTGQIWDSGKIFDSTAKHGDGGVPSAFVIGKQQVITGWDKALVGKKVGSRVLIVVPPGEGYGPTGKTDANNQQIIKGTDTLVFVVDILAAN